jgi:hypothetical protein
MNNLKAHFGLRLPGFAKSLFVVDHAAPARPVSVYRPQRFQTRGKPMQGVTMSNLFRMSLDPVVGALKRYRLQAELRSLRMHASYFQWQQENGAAGLADTQKRIAVAQSDLNALSREYFQ